MLVVDALEVPGRFVDGRPLVAAADLERLVGWTVRPEGLCRGDVCIPSAAFAAPIADSPTDGGPILDGAADEVSQSVDLLAVADVLGRPMVADGDTGIVALALPSEERRRALVDRQAPDFALPDLTGETRRLSDWAGRKRLLVTFASWCGCRYDLPGWQALDDELDGLTVVAVAMDQTADDVRPWVDGISMPVLVDADHVLSELYAMSNVPTVVWIDEDDGVARPNTLAFGTDTFAEITGVAAGPHLDAVRRWVHDGELPPEAGEVADLDDDEVLARLHFRVGVVALRCGHPDAGRRHLLAAAALAPYDWTVRRAAMPLLGQDPFGQEFMDLYDQWRSDGSPYHGLLP